MPFRADQAMLQRSVSKCARLGVGIAPTVLFDLSALVFRPSAAASRDGLVESRTCHRHYCCAGLLLIPDFPPHMT